MNTFNKVLGENEKRLLFLLKTSELFGHPNTYLSGYHRYGLKDSHSFISLQFITVFNYFGAQIIPDLASRCTFNLYCVQAPCCPVLIALNIHNLAVAGKKGISHLLQKSVGLVFFSLTGNYDNI